VFRNLRVRRRVENIGLCFWFLIVCENTGFFNPIYVLNEAVLFGLLTGYLKKFDMFGFLINCRKKIGIILTPFLLGSFVFLTGYTRSDFFISQGADSLKIAPFVERDFPFVPGSVDARKLGPGFPDNNISARVLSIQLNDSTYAAFDTDLLRWSVAWTGKFLPMVLMAQISYNDFFNKNNKVPVVLGTPKIATGLYPGWSENKPVFEDIRPEPAEATLAKWGPIPVENGRWRGVYVYGNKAILNYTVGKTEIFEMPESAHFDDQTVFERTFQSGTFENNFYLTVAEMTNATGSETKNRISYLYQGAGKDTVTAVAVLGKNTANLQTGVSANRYLSVSIPASAKPVEFSVAVWKGPVSKKTAFEKFCRKLTTSFPEFRKGGPGLWKETVVTKGKLSPDTAAYVTDQLALPLHNPWNRNVRIADIAFFKDGRGAAVTFEGDVWLVGGLNKGLENIRWKRFASGLHEPMSIEVVRDTIYVFGREGIVRLHDLNKDGFTDFYENFSNIMSQSAESREWAGDMVLAPDGGFYVAKGGSQSNGPGVTPQVAKGFRAGSQHNGTILKISPDGLKYEVIATGLRGPYLGIHPENGTLTASDQQGNFVPSTPIYLIHKGDYFGVPPTEHRKDNPTIAPPLTWIPHRVDRSSISQTWVTGGKMGPLNGNLIHFSFAHPGLFRVLVDSASKITQGGVSFIQANYPAPTSKGTISPIDGQLYISGFNLWGSSSTGVSALLRLRYTGKPSYMPNQFHAAKQGIIIGFDSELDAASAIETTNFQVKRWNYKRTEEYGSGQYKTDGSTGEEPLTVAASYISSDRKKIFLLIPDMKEVMQMEVAYKLLARDGKKITDQFWFTVNSADDIDLNKYGFNDVNLSLLTAKQESSSQTAKNETVSAEKGKELFSKMACMGCHSDGLKTEGMYGPPFQHLYKSQRHFEDGSTAVADEKYIRESILTPSAKIVKGYNEEMPSFVGVLSDSDIESITLFIKSLAKR
jgi:cytochrome c551/c552